MNTKREKTDKEVLDKQKSHWEKTLSENHEMFGEKPSEPAKKAVELFKKKGKKKILELGAGQGRDTLFFAKNGFEVTALDYSRKGVEDIIEKVHKLGLDEQVKVKCHDVRYPLPFKNDSFDACYSHMLYCMALTTSELEFLSDEIRRVLRPDGINIYTVRHTKDVDYGTGTHRGEDIYQIGGGFVVHFFNRQKVERLAKDYDIVSIDEFDEGALPRKLFRVTLRKKS
ncbi:MAG TPA: class I SAM-dependent methyltransferase [Nitrospinota bacterium]|nr:class I SAM-dependent methyltransferase [Nitrospinota bacterium]